MFTFAEQSVTFFAHNFKPLLSIIAVKKLYKLQLRLVQWHVSPAIAMTSCAWHVVVNMLTNLSV